MIYDVVIVGGGIAGLTAGAFISKEGHRVLICEKEKWIGGLVNSFNYKDFRFDGGIRAMENSGVLLPMVKGLGLDIEFKKSYVSVGMEDAVVSVETKSSLSDYQRMLETQFPDNKEDIKEIIKEIGIIMNYMDVLYGIDNPLFMDLKNDKRYLFKTLIPWLFKYLKTIRKIIKLDQPIEEYLTKFSDNQSLINMIDQHFFKETPAFFALSYFSLYLDYQYPKGGTGTLTEKMAELIIANHGIILKETTIQSIDDEKKVAVDSNGNVYSYKKLIWAADQKRLYDAINTDSIKDDTVRKNILDRKSLLKDKVGGDSVHTLYLTVDIEPEYFKKISNPHFFYTPYKDGLFNVTIEELMTKGDHDTKHRYITDKSELLSWLERYYRLTTYEISIPVLRDPKMAPEGKTGLIISTLFEHSLVKHIKEMGWYDEFKQISEKHIIEVLNATIYKGIKEKTIDSFSSTPLTIERITGNSDGAITGWAFTNRPIPAVNKMPRVTDSVLTPISDVFQAGQWSYSPAGLPISIMTGKIAADKVNKLLSDD
ncbi:MAG: NAD(P)/FAD-dependent oxidoreductase [Dethiosulfatibacter sp.]|nr:NAD(P)/FAD-dependent oxidoreductase [Dethiosulfatibacter sp.]